MNLFDVKTDLADLFEKTIKWNKIANYGAFDFSQSRRDLQHTYLMGEISTLFEVVYLDDEGETLKAICDVLFTSVYALYLDTATSEPLENSLTPCFYPDLTLYSLACEVEEAFDDFDYFYICELILSYSLTYDFDFKDAYAEVVKSNYSKFPVISEAECQMELRLFLGNEKYQNVLCTLVEGGYCVFRSSYGSGKVFNPQSFCQPNLKRFYEEQ